MCLPGLDPYDCPALLAVHHPLPLASSSSPLPPTVPAASNSNCLKVLESNRLKVIDLTNDLEEDEFDLPTPKTRATSPIDQKPILDDDNHNQSVSRQNSQVESGPAITAQPSSQGSGSRRSFLRSPSIEFAHSPSTSSMRSPSKRSTSARLSTSSAQVSFSSHFCLTVKLTERLRPSQ